MSRLHSVSNAGVLGQGSYSNGGLANRINSYSRRRFEEVNRLIAQCLEWYKSQSKLKKLIINLLVICGILLALFVLIFHKELLQLLIRIAKMWKGLKFGWILLFSLVFLVSFPPLIGFTDLCILAGMVYGFPSGWFLITLASVIGSLCSFLFFRYILKNQATKLVNKNEMFRAFAEVLRDDSSLFLLILIRLCPFPYSLSNGALASIPELSPVTYLLASVLTSPKLFLHIFVGNKLIEVGDDKTSKSTKIFDIIGMVMALLASTVTTYLIYIKMKRTLMRNRDMNDGQYDESYEQMVFGNFNDDVDTANNVELNSADFDADNFIIEDDDDLLEHDITELSRDEQSKQQKP